MVFIHMSEGRRRWISMVKVCLNRFTTITDVLDRVASRTGADVAHSERIVT